MSEQGFADTLGHLREDGGAAPGGSGSQLRQAREAAGIHIAALASALKVPVARLQALEDERFDLLPDPPFIRALAASVCRVLKLDAAPILAGLPQREPLSLARPGPDAHGKSFRMDGRGYGRQPAGLSRPLIGVVVLLLVAAGILMVLPRARLGQWMAELSSAVHERLPSPENTSDAGNSGMGGTGTGGQGGADGTPASQASNAEASAAQRDASASPATTSADAPQAKMPGASMGGGSGVATSALPATAPQTPQSAGMRSGRDASATGGSEGNGGQTPVLGSSTQVAADAVEASPGSLLQLRANAESWIKVSDAKGTVLVQKNLAAGATETVSGALPLSVVIGRADSTEVQVRGKPLALAPLTRNNVARFEVK